MSAKLKEDAVQIFRAGLEAVDPVAAVRRHLRLEGDQLRVGERTFHLNEYDTIWVAGAGKASAAMALGVEQILGDLVAGGLVVVKDGHGAPLKRIRVAEAGHPAPDERGWRATGEMVASLEKLDERSLVILLISGGGSALMPMPAPGLSLADKIAATELLLKSGASIHEINAVRKHLSRVKGGQLARSIYPASTVALILSDVVGDPLDVIASGPVVPDPSTYEDCGKILAKYGLTSKVPAAVQAHLQRGMRGEIPETPGPGDPVFQRVVTTLVGTNLQALEAGAARAGALGYHPLILSSLVEGDTREAASFHVAVAREVLRSGHPVPRPACVISGGETTVVVTGTGKGGRNQEFALAAALLLAGEEDVCVLCAGTDGTDGPTDAAGGVVDGSTVARGRELGLQAEVFLANNDSYHFLQAVGALLITGPTKTNVMDMRVVLVG